MIRALIVLLPVLAVAGLSWLLALAWHRTRTNALREQLASAHRAIDHECDRRLTAERQLDRVRELAETNAGIDPILSAQILAEITPTERHPQ